MNKSYQRLTMEERIQIEKLLSHGQSYSEIARQLHRHKSTISREIARIKSTSYSSFYSHGHAYNQSMNRKYGKSKILLNRTLELIIIAKLELFWSPEQTSKHSTPPPDGGGVTA